MARATVDFSDVQEFDPIPKGEYAVVVAKVEYRESQQEDKFDYLNWELQVTEEGEFKDRRVWFVTSFSPKALWRMKAVFEELGVYEDELEIDYDDETMLVTEPELVGLPAIAVISQRTYEGRVQNQVDALVSNETPKQGTKKEPGAKKPPAAGATTKTQKAPAATGAKRKFQ